MLSPRPPSWHINELARLIRRHERALAPTAIPTLTNEEIDLRIEAVLKRLGIALPAK